MVPQVLRYFDLRLADPKKEWKTVNHWFIAQTGIEVVFTQRKKLDLRIFSQ
jgi:hypothetical protein